MDQPVRIQLPSAKDGEEFLRNIRFKNVSFAEQFYIIYAVIHTWPVYLLQLFKQYMT